MRTALTGFEGQDIRSLLDFQASVRADRTFLIWEPADGPGLTWSYAHFILQVRRFSAGLIERGLRPGDRLIIHMENCPEYLVAWLGAAYAGVVAVTTNALSSPEEFAYFAGHSRARAAVTQPGLLAAVAAARDLEWLAVTGSSNEPAIGRDAFEAVSGDPDGLPARPHDPLAPFGIQYTSGTTSRPKAVLWTHANALWGGRISALHEGLRSDDVHLVHLPLHHTNAQVYSTLAALTVGAAVVLAPKFSASRFWPISVKHGCTWTSVVPFCLKALAAQPAPERHAYRMWGNAICEPPTDALFGVRTLGWWGMTETVTHGTVGALHGRDPSMSMGRPSPAYRIHVLDADGGPVRPGEVGELHVGGQRGVSLFSTYDGDPAATDAAFTPEGLLRTGDRVRLGEDGWLYFADRSKDMLKVGGENVAASEVERVIQSVPGVMEAAVVARPDPMLDEAPVAFVITAPGAPADLAARIQDACRTALAPFKRPREVRVVEDFPRATLGKVAKAELRRALQDEAASPQSPQS